MLEIVETNHAIDDVARIWYFIGVENMNSADPIAADRVVLKIKKTYEMLAEFPARKQIEDTNLFKATVKGYPQYLIIYEYNDESLTVLRVISCSQDWERIIQEL